VTDARLWHPWLRINRVLRVMLCTHWSAEAWAQVRIEFKRALELRSEIRRRGMVQLIAIRRASRFSPARELHRATRVAAPRCSRQDVVFTSGVCPSIASTIALHSATISEVLLSTTQTRARGGAQPPMCRAPTPMQ
jgi:hypothetical protein